MTKRRARTRTTAFPAMGTRVELIVPAGTPATVDDAVQGLFAEWEAALSRFRAASELSRLNACAGRPFHAGPVLFAAVTAALRAARATHGVFDPCLGRHMAALGYDRPFRPGAGAPLTLLTTLPGPTGRWRDVHVDERRSTVRLPADTAVDLGGIGKGMAVDAAAALLTARGVHGALVSAGGDMAVTGPPPGRDAWEVRLTEMDGDRRVALRHGALATSSVRRRRWTQGRHERHHLVDPRTGASAATGVRAVTVAAPTCEMAEVAATAALVLGAAEAPGFLARAGLAGVVVPHAGTPVAVRDWPREEAA